MKIARKSDWKCLPMPEGRIILPLDRAYSEMEMERIRRGLIPREMEDKWFIYWEDDRLHFHRSWTGLCCYIARFVAEGDRWRMVEAEVNPELANEKMTDEVNAALIPYLVDLLLLGRPADFPITAGSDAEKAMEMWAWVGRAMLGEGPGSD